MVLLLDLLVRRLIKVESFVFLRGLLVRSLVSIESLEDSFVVLGLSLIGCLGERCGFETHCVRNVLID